MTSDRIKEIQEQTAYPESVSVKQALLQVWNECQQQLEKEREGKIQLCPKCQGQGIVSKPPWIPADIHEWSASAASFTCNLCNGAKVITQNQSK